MLRSGLVAALCGLALLPAAAAAEPRALIVFLPSARAPAPSGELAAPTSAGAPARDWRSALLGSLGRRPRLAVGWLSPIQGRSTGTQALLDITQGARISRSVYAPKQEPRLALVRSGASGSIAGWSAAVARARGAPATLVPGLLASSIPGGAAFVGAGGGRHREAVAAADRAGRVARVSIGARSTLVARALAQLRRQRLVVVALPPGRGWGRALDRLLAARAPDELLVALESPPERRGARLLPVALATGGRPGELTSASTRQEGLVAGIDLLPTVLRRLGLPVPDAVKGRPIRSEGTRDVSALRRFEARLRVVYPRRMPALRTLLLALLAIVAALAAARGRRGLRVGLRLAGLAVLWLPSVLLATAALAPGRRVELALVALLPLLLAAVTDLLVSWPRGPLVPAAVGLGAHAVDLAFGSPLIARSLLGSNPAFGARFYGVGNELEAVLPALLLVGVAAALGSRPRSRGAASAFALAGLALGIVVGWGRLGADVGGVVTIAAGTTAAATLALPGGSVRRALALAVGVPLVALVALALLDAVTGADSHFARALLGARRGGDLGDTLSRRTQLAWHSLWRGLMPLATALAVAGIAYATANARRVYAPLGDAPAWRAGLAGGAVAAVAGALANDSGPVLLVITTFALCFATLYVRGAPAAEGRAAAAEAGASPPAIERTEQPA